ncbi:MAG: tRNA pseudouridine(38-40) synthase TruA [Angelakisella sp.]
MRNLKLTIAYRGTAYHGFQVQKNAISVTQVFQDAVEAVFGVRYDIKGCSRTDAGVHANRFVLSLICNEQIPCENVVRALNVNLPADIAVLSCVEEREDFHPRYDTTGKRYIYRIWNAPTKNPFEYDTSLHYTRPLDIAAMNAAAVHLLGRHDFSAFCAAGGKVEDKVRTITDCTVTRQGNMVTLSITGDGFLYNMVRIIVGTLLEVSAGKLSPSDVPHILASCDRHRAGFTAPPQGLFLDDVFYTHQA